MLTVLTNLAIFVTILFASLQQSLTSLVFQCHQKVGTEKVQLSEHLNTRQFYSITYLTLGRCIINKKRCFLKKKFFEKEVFEPTSVFLLV
jgi:hypothetical protein